MTQTPTDHSISDDLWADPALTPFSNLSPIPSSLTPPNYNHTPNFSSISSIIPYPDLYECTMHELYPYTPNNQTNPNIPTNITMLNDTYVLYD